jgi:hypothetical protein
MTNKINLKDRNTIELLKSAVMTKQSDIKEQRRAKEDLSDLDFYRYEQVIAEYALLEAQLRLEWRLAFNKEFTDQDDPIEVKKDKLEADICRLNVDKAQQNLDIADSDYRLALSQK